MGKLAPQHSILVRIFGLQQHSESHFLGPPVNEKQAVCTIMMFVYFLNYKVKAAIIHLLIAHTLIIIIGYIL